MTYSYLMEQQVQGAIAHELCDYAEELGLVAYAKDLDDVVEPGFVEHLCLLQQAVPLSETQPVIRSQSSLSDKVTERPKQLGNMVRYGKYYHNINLDTLSY